MRRTYSTITPSVVHSLTRSLLEKHLGFRGFKQSVTLHQLLDLLLLAGVLCRTLSAIATRYFNSYFSHETARQAVYANLTTPQELTRSLVDALHAVAAFSRQDRRRLWTVAIDLHFVCYYGSKEDAGVVGGQKKQGTKFFHGYATAVIIHKRRRYTVGLLCVEKGLKPHEVVQALLEQITSRGLRIGGGVLDAGFDSGQTIRLLQEKKLSYTIPLRRKGNGSNRRNDCYQKPSGTVRTMKWTTEKSRQSVSTRVLVWQRKGESHARVYAFAGWGSKQAVSEARRAWLGRRRYRERFGIESSYRQKNQCRGWTTSPSAEYRLLLEGIALVLRQVWVCLTQQIAKDRGLCPNAWVSELPLVEMLQWLADHIQTLYPYTRRIKLTKTTLTFNVTR
jgi:hypothetical protein